MIKFKTASINFTDQGTGNVIVLLHGYLETLEIWYDFAKELAKSFRVISMDIPGHGMSGKVSEIHTMDLMAEGLNTVLKNLNIDKAILVGHSMGGYVAMSFLANYKSKILGLCLFHSNPFSDNDEKKANRDREIEIINQGKLYILLNTNILKGFATDNLEYFKARVEWAKKIAANCKPEGIIALLEGLKIRPDRQMLLKETDIPVLFILGRKDNYIDFKTMFKVAGHSPKGEILVLDNSGHMGFIEEPGICIEGIKSFSLKCFKND
jgi:pimeloyl-ACP methyl ester carboxylesterase